MSTDVPIIDLQKFSSANPAERAGVIGEVRTALEHVGFFMVSGHGVPQPVIDRAMSASLEFFDRPEAEKERFAPISNKITRGYNAMRGRTVGLVLNPSLKRSLQEGFAMGMMDVPDDPYFHTKEAGRSFAPNIWPDAPSDFQPTMRAYYAGMDQLFRKIMQLFANALELPETFFDDKVARHSSTLRLIHYPALDREPEEGEYRSGEHTDSGTLTILHIDDTPQSLQVRTRGGQWIDINKVPGTFIINIGDLMSRWTNDKWVSTLHRVANPPVVNGRSDRRLSIACFCQTNYDTLVDCLPNCSGPENPPRYPPVVTGEFSLMRAALRYGFETAPSG